MGGLCDRLGPVATEKALTHALGAVAARDCRRLLVVLLTAAFTGLAGRLRTGSAAGSRITIMQSEAPLTMDPGDETASLTADVLSPMYEGLTRFGANFMIVPSLATRWYG